VSGVVFDTAALIALERADRAVLVLVGEARDGNYTITLPAGCVAQAWRVPSRQARMASFLRLPNVKIVALDDAEARLVGLLLGRAGRTDVTDGHVALCGLRLDQAILTSDPDDIGVLAPRLEIRRV
jgi:hypothetical protein